MGFFLFEFDLLWFVEFGYQPLFNRLTGLEENDQECAFSFFGNPCDVGEFRICFKEMADSKW